MIRTSFLLLLITSLISACGGGSDSSGGSSSSNSENIFSNDFRSASSGVRLLHGAIDAAPLALRTSSSAEPIATARFSLDAPFVGFKGTQIISVTPLHTVSPTFYNSELVSQKNSRATVLFYGNNKNLGLSTVLLPDTRNATLAQGNAAIRIIHAVIGAAQLEINGPGISSSADFGRASNYTELPAGPHNFTVKRINDGQQIYSGTVDLASGQHFSLFATGEIDYYTKVRLVQD